MAVIDLAVARKAKAMSSLPDAKPVEEDVWGPVLLKVAAQDRPAFARLFHHFAPQLKAFGLSTVLPDRSGQFADELVQEVMITVWNKAASYDPAKASAATWIFTIARNKRIDLLRKLNRHKGMVDIDDVWLLEDESSGPVQTLQQRVMADHVRKSLVDLPPAQREVLLMAFMEGKSHSEIAAELALPLGTVKSRIRLAMQRLQLVLDRQDHL